MTGVTGAAGPAGRSRYPGTHPFTDSPEDAARFFGRTAEAEELYLRVLSVPLLVQFARSALGKTSLLQAALVPKLRRKAFLPVMIRLNIATETLMDAVVRSIGEACRTEGLEPPDQSAEGLWELFSSTTVWRDGVPLTPVLVFDQFEEVFTLRDKAFREQLAGELGALASGRPPERLRGRPGGATPPASAPDVKIVVSLREDYLGSLEEFSAAIPTLFSERLRLGPLSEDAAREAITEPARLSAAAGQAPYTVPAFELESEALDSLIRYLKGSSGVIEPFQLQLLCRRAETIAAGKPAADGGGAILTLADFDGGKSFASVLKNFYRDTLAKLPRSQRAKTEALCEEGLLDGAGRRLMLEERQIHDSYRLEPASLQTLTKERLLHREPRLESVFYEISHDRLAESISASRRFRLPRNVRRGLAIAGIAAALIVAVLVWSNLRVSRAHGIAEAQREAARSEQQRAESMLQFLLGEGFLGEVRDFGRSALLEQVHNHAGQRVGIDAGATLTRGLVLRNRADLEFTRGSLADAIAGFRAALETIRQSAESLDRWRELARTEERLAEALTERGEVADASAHQEAAIAAWRRVVGKAPESGDCGSLASGLATSAMLKLRGGQSFAAIANMEESLDLSMALLFGGVGSSSGCAAHVPAVASYPDARALAAFSAATYVRASIFGDADSDDADVDANAAAILAGRASWLSPLSTRLQKDELTARALRGVLRQKKSPNLALTDYGDTLVAIETLRRSDPENRLWQRERAAVQLLLGDAIVACVTNRNCQPSPSIDDAEALILEASATLRALGKLDPSRTSLKSDLGWALTNHAAVLSARGQHPQRLVVLQEAEGKYREARRDLDTSWIGSISDVLKSRSQALDQLGRKADARAVDREAVALFQQIADQHSKVDTVVWISLLSTIDAQKRLGDSAGAAAAEREKKRLDDAFAAAWRERSRVEKDNMPKAQCLEQNQTLRTAELVDPGLLHNASVTCLNAGAERYKAGSHADALRELAAAAHLGRGYVRSRPGSTNGYDTLRNTYDWIRLTHAALNAKTSCIAAHVASMRAAQMAVWLAPPGEQHVAMHAKLVEAGRSLAKYLLDLADDRHLNQALAIVEEEVAVAQELVRRSPGNADYLQLLGNSKLGLAMIRAALKQPGPEDAVRSGLINLQKAIDIDGRNADYTRELGVMREYLADLLDAAGNKTAARQERQLASQAFQRALKLNPGDTMARDKGRNLAARLQ